MVILGIIEVNYSLKMSPAPLSYGICIFFLLFFYILQGRCEITSHNKNQNFMEGYIESENSFETLIWNTIE